MDNTTLQTRPLDALERNLVAAVVALVVGLGLLGMVNSFSRVAQAVEPSFGALAFTVPLGIDVGIAVFTALDLVLARLGMRAGWLRVFPWLLIGATVFLNIAEERSLVGVVAHAALPGLWVVAVEAGSHALRTRTGLINGRARTGMDRIRWSRWLLAPLATLRLWRRMVLWELTDYRAALSRERDRQLSRCELADRYGRFSWRWKAPRRQRVLYRLGELAPSGALASPELAPVQRRPARRRSSAARKETRPTSSSVVDLVPLGREVAAHLASEGRSLTRRDLVAGLRQAGQPISTTRANQLLALLRSDPGQTDAATRVEVAS